MASVRDTINGALRKIGRLAAGREPRTADQQDALSALVGMYRAWINNGSFGRLDDVIPRADYTARPNQRVFRNSYDVLQISLPETVLGWWRWDCLAQTLSYVDEPDRPGNLAYAVTPSDLSVVVISDALLGTTADFIYDGHTKRWQSLYDLALNDEAPLSFRDPKGLESALATQIVDEFGGDLPQMTARMAATFQSSLATRFSMPREQAVGVYV